MLRRGREKPWLSMRNRYWKGWTAGLWWDTYQHLGNKFLSHHKHTSFAWTLISSYFWHMHKAPFRMLWDTSTKLTWKRRRRKHNITFEAVTFPHPPCRWTWRMPTRPSTPSVWSWPWWVVGTWISIFTIWVSLDWGVTGCSSTLHRSVVGSCTSTRSQYYTGQPFSTRWAFGLGGYTEGKPLKLSFFSPPSGI